MQKMTLAQKEAYVRTLAARRADLQGQINAANEKRRVFVAEAMKTRPAQDTLDQAMLASVKEQAEKKGFTLK